MAKKNSDSPYDVLTLALADSIISETKKTAFTSAIYGQHEAGWLSFYDVFSRIGLEKELAPLQGLMTVARNGGWWWPLEGITVCTERPMEINRDDQGRLHNESGPAIGYPDMWAVYVIHGVRVTEQIVMHPETLTAQQIRDESNQEVRRIMMDRFTEARYIQDIGAEVVSEDDFGVLYRAEVPGDEDLIMVKVVNSSPEPDGSYKDYWLRVPPTVRTPKEAVAWTFGEEPKQYAPLVET